MGRTAIDIVLEGVSSGSITQEDAKILLEVINQKGGNTFVPVPYREINIPDWTYDPYRPGQPWYTVTSHTSLNSQAEGTTNNQSKTTITTNG